VPTVGKSGSVNFLEHSGPVKELLYLYIPVKHSVSSTGQKSITSQRTIMFKLAAVIIHNRSKCNKKGKAAPLQAWSGPEDSRNLRFPDFMTTA
jgi:hypothetical protein